MEPTPTPFLERVSFGAGVIWSGCHFGVGVILEWVSFWSGCHFGVGVILGLSVILGLGVF